MKKFACVLAWGIWLGGCGSRVIGNLGDGAASGDETGGSSGNAGLPGSTPRMMADAAGRTGGGGSSSASVEAGGGSGALGGASETLAGAFSGGAAGVASADGGEAGLPDFPPLTAVPVAHLALDECSGPAIDTQSSSTGQRFEVGCAPGVLTRAASFSDSLESKGPPRIELADEPRFAFQHELTVAAWVKPTQSRPLLPIVSKWYNMDSFQLSLREVKNDENGTVSLRYAFSIAEPEGQWGRPSDAISPQEVKLGAWTHVAGVYRWSPNGQVGHITLYVDGQPVAETNTKVGTNGLQQSTRPIQIGYVDESTSFVGLIDEVRLYDVALGPELARLYQSPANP